MTLLNRIRRQETLYDLTWWDILILTIIMFGQAIYHSFQALSVIDNGSSGGLTEFTSAINWQAFTNQSLLLLVAFCYLWLRHFDFSRWNIKINGKSILLGIGLFLVAAILFDVYFMIAYQLFPPADTGIFYQSTSTTHPLIQRLSEIDLSLIVYSILNGFYEEIYFLGICLAVRPEHKKWAVLYSLIIRYSFHTYQGHLSAIAIGFLLGILYYFAYLKKKDKNLFPFFLSHAIGDIMGVGILSYLM